MRDRARIRNFPCPARPRLARAIPRMDAKQWCYTAFYDIEKPVIPDELVHYRIEGREICPTTNKEHIQGYVWLKKKMRVTGLKKHHATAEFTQAKGSPWQNFVYCSKDNKFQELGSRPKEPKKKSEADNTFAEALAADTIEEAIKIVKQGRPRDYCLHGESIERNLKKARYTPYVPEHKEFNTDKTNLTKATLIYGASNLGKTQYALSHFERPLLVSHIDDLKQLNVDNDGIVFDDMSFKHWPPESVIHLLDMELPRTINVRYGTITIPKGTKKIFTHNNDNPYYEIDKIVDEQRDAIERRLNRVRVHNKLF